MELKVTLQIDDLSSIKCTLKLSIQKGNVFFEYADEMNHSIIRESITQFRTIQLSEEDPLRVAIQGPIVDRILHFDNPKEMNDLFNFMRQQGILEPCENDLRTFLINIKNETKKPQPLQKFIDTIYKATNKGPQIIQRPVDAFLSHSILSYLPTDKPIQLTKEIVDSSDLRSLPLYLYQISEDIYPVIIEKLVKPADITEEYKKLKKQWQSTSKDQWKHFMQLREFVHSVEIYIQRSQMDSELHKQLFFNVSLSLFTRYYAQLSFSPKLMFIVEILIICFISSRIKENKFITTLGETIDFESAELLIFSYLAEIWESINLTSLTIDKESIEIRKTLSSISPSTLAMLDDRKMMYLDFAVQDADVFFSRINHKDEALLLFLSALQTGDISLFRKNVICASLVLLQEKLQLIPINDASQFVETYQYNMKLMNPRLLILNNNKMCTSNTEK